MKFVPFIFFGIQTGNQISEGCAFGNHAVSHSIIERLLLRLLGSQCFIRHGKFVTMTIGTDIFPSIPRHEGIYRLFVFNVILTHFDDLEYGQVGYINLYME